MPIYYLDTSALLKRYKREVGSQFLDSLFDDRISNETFTSSRYTTLETESAARRLLRGRELSQRAYNLLLLRYYIDAVDHLVFQPLIDEVFDEAITTIQRNVLRPGDGLHLATANVVKTAQPDELTFMVCADQRLCAATIADGLDLLNPEEPDALQRLYEIRSRS